ncbi:hypothetical protein Anas_14276 [Armadillidium nasatum]|uniref:MARVEL domain-containing protein n=1 Tax=Armadillidium nasatum TaxID=96803 RepID=A0A5N5TDS9_9CRUS|nr:hypothetical protein Anas_14276 [Armadillidium nasatum]
MSTGFPYNSTRDADYISFVTVCGLLISGILLFLYFINAVVYFTVIPWLLIELVYNALWCFFCFVGGIVGAVFSSKHAVGDVGYAASAFFLFLAMCVYGYYAFRLYLLYKQNIRLVIVTTETTTTTTTNHP